MKVVLTEKPSVARDLAGFLGARHRHDGYLEGGGYQVAWALGHLVELCEPQDYDPALRKWSLDTLPFIPPDFRLRVIDSPAAEHQFSVVKRLLRDADEIIAATDAGREGELIFRNILEMAGLGHRSFRRLWLNSLNPTAVRHAFQSLRPSSDFDSLFEAARCRSQADWIVGLNATRYYTVRYGEKGLLWSAGRVQTPVLALLVHRDDTILAFRPETFFELWTVYRDVDFKYAGERFGKKEDANALLSRVQDSPFIVRTIEPKRRVEPPPQLYDLTDLQRDMNRRYGLSADGVLKAAQRLYESKAITYPRTDSRYITQDMKAEVREILSKLAPHKHAEISKLNLASLGFSARMVNNQKVTDHHAILPTGVWPTSLSGAEAKIFDAIVTRLIAAFYPPCIKLLTTIHGEVNKVPFRATGVQVLDPGWTELYPRKARVADPGIAVKALRQTLGDALNEGDESHAWGVGESSRDSQPTHAKSDEQPLPSFTVGETGPHQPTIREGQTKPPAHFNENTLLAAMETAGKLVDDDELREALKERGLGTPATRASIIETLIVRGYVRRDKKNLLATDLGRYLIAIVRDPRLKSAELTGGWEAGLKQIEQARLEPRKFMEDIVQYTEEIVRPDDVASVDPNQWGVCPRCGAPVVQGKRDFGCSRWREGCAFVLRREFDGIELSTDEVRQLLHRRLTPWPQSDERAGQSLLYLSDTGALFMITKPSGETSSTKQKRGARRTSAKRGAKSSTRQKSPARRKENTNRVKRTPPQTNQLEKPAPSAASDAVLDLERIVAKYSGRKPEPARPRPAPAHGKTLGKCPVCGRPVVEQKKSFSCSGWREGCQFVIWKTIAGKRITSRTAETLLKKGVTAQLKGFKSKAGKPFEARLRIANSSVTIEFST